MNLFVFCILTVLFLVVVFKKSYTAVEWIVAGYYVFGFFGRFINWITGNQQGANYLWAAPSLFALAYVIVFIMKGDLKLQYFFKTKLNILFLVYFLFSFFQIFNPNIPFIVGLYGFRLAVVPLFFYYVGQRYFSDRKRFFRFVSLIIIMTILDVIYASVESMYGFLPWDLALIEENEIFSGYFSVFFTDTDEGSIGFKKFVGFSGNSYALHYPVAFFFIIFWAIKSHVPTRKKIFFFSAAAILFSYFTERAPIAMIFIGSVVIFLDFSSLSRFIVSTTRVLTAGIVVTILFFSFIKVMSATGERRYDRLLELQNPLEAGNIEFRREVAWANALLLIERNPLGYGVGKATFSSASVATDVYVETESMYLRIALESGIIGLLLFLVLLFSIMIKTIGNIRLSKDFLFKRISIGFSGALIAVFFAGIPNHALDYNIGIPFWMFAGLMNNGRFEDENIEPSNSE